MTASLRATVVVVTGLSGAGKSTALHALEDLGFFCVDNLPTALAPGAVDLCEHGGMTRVALGMDVRVRAFLGEVGQVLKQLENSHRREVQLLFLDASDEELLRRFSETRRPHPLSAGGGALAVLDGVRIERERLAPLRARATRVLDTTGMSVHQLRRSIIAHFGPASGGAPRMTTRFVAFGFKYGPPVDADLVFDVRFLDNPYFVRELRPLPGTDPAVVDFVRGLPETDEFLHLTTALLAFLLPRYEREGKSYLTIGIGCTGGRHRSVVIADALAAVLSKQLGVEAVALHRDIARGLTAEGAVPPSAEGSDPRMSEVELRGASAPPPPVAPAAASTSAWPKERA